MLLSSTVKSFNLSNFLDAGVLHCPIGSSILIVFPDSERIVQGNRVEFYKLGKTGDKEQSLYFEVVSVLQNNSSLYVNLLRIVNTV